MRENVRHKQGILPQGTRLRLDGDILVATVLINLLTLCVPIAMMQIFTRVIPNNSIGTLAGTFIILLGYIVMDTLLKISRARLFMAESAEAEQRVASAVFDSLFHAPLSALSKIGSDGLAERLNRLRDIGKLHSNIVLASRIDLMFIIVFIAVIFALSPVLAGVSLMCICIAALWSIRVRARFLTASRARDLNDSRRTSFLIEIFRLTPEVKLLGIEQVLLRRYEMLQQNASSASEDLVRINASAATIAAMVGQVATGLVSVTGAYLVIQNQIGLADLAATILLTGRTVQPVIQALFVDMDIEVLRRTDAQCRELVELMEQPTDLSEDGHAEQSGPVSLQLQGVTLRDPWTGATLLSRQYLNIPPGSLTVIHGRSDAPAEALLHLLRGAENLDEGYVRLRDKDHGPVGPVVFLGHDLDLHDGPVIQNLTAFRGRSFEPDALRLGRQLGIDTDIQVMPGGYSHVLYQDGRGHGSHGFCRKLRLARSLAIPAGLFLLDRPFLGLDHATQKNLSICIQELRRHSTVVIANPPPDLKLEPDLTIRLRPDLAPQLDWADGQDPELSAFLLARKAPPAKQVPA